MLTKRSFIWWLFFLSLPSFPLDALPKSNEIKSFETSLTNKMHSQHEPMKYANKGVLQQSAVVTSAVWNNDAIKYPNGVFQSNGSLANYGMMKFFKMYFHIFFFYIRTSLDRPSNMIDRLNLQRNNCTMSPRLQASQSQLKSISLEWGTWTVTFVRFLQSNRCILNRIS